MSILKIIVICVRISGCFVFRVCVYLANSHPNNFGAIRVAACTAHQSACPSRLPVRPPPTVCLSRPSVRPSSRPGRPDRPDQPFRKKSVIQECNHVNSENNSNLCWMNESTDSVTIVRNGNLNLFIFPHTR